MPGFFQCLDLLALLGNELRIFIAQLLSHYLLMEDIFTLVDKI